MAEKIKIPEEVKKIIRRCIEDYNKFHWGFEPKKLYKVKRIQSPPVLFMLGMMKLIIYETKKKGDEQNTLYVHRFHSPYPILASDKLGHGAQLYILGGTYDVEDRGIVK